jgi:hypothetical protein
MNVCMLQHNPVDQNDRVFLCKELKGRQRKALARLEGGIAMKLLFVVLILKTIVAFLETTGNKNRKENRNDAGNRNVQHPAATLLR